MPGTAVRRPRPWPEEHCNPAQVRLYAPDRRGARASRSSHLPPTAGHRKPNVRRPGADRGRARHRPPLRRLRERAGAARLEVDGVDGSATSGRLGLGERARTPLRGEPGVRRPRACSARRQVGAHPAGLGRRVPHQRRAARPSPRSRRGGERRRGRGRDVRRHVRRRSRRTCSTSVGGAFEEMAEPMLCPARRRTESEARALRGRHPPPDRARGDRQAERRDRRLHAAHRRGAARSMPGRSTRSRDDPALEEGEVYAGGKNGSGEDPDGPFGDEKPIHPKSTLPLGSESAAAGLRW